MKSGKLRGSFWLAVDFVTCNAQPTMPVTSLVVSLDLWKGVPLTVCLRELSLGRPKDKSVKSIRML